MHRARSLIALQVAAQTGVAVADQTYAKDPRFTQPLAPPDTASLASLRFGCRPFRIERDLESTH